MSSPSCGLRKLLLLELPLLPSPSPSRLLILVSRLLLLLYLVRWRGRVAPAERDGEAEEDVALGQDLSSFLFPGFFQGQKKTVSHSSLSVP